MQVVNLERKSGGHFQAESGGQYQRKMQLVVDNFFAYFPKLKSYNMRVSIKLIFSILVILLTFTCCFPDQWHGIRITNKTQLTICIYGEYILPDTSLALEKPTLKKIGPNESIHIFDSDINDFELERFETEKLSIFVLSKDTVESYSWEEIRSDYKILKRYEINEQDLVDMGGSIIYP